MKKVLLLVVSSIFSSYAQAGFFDRKVDWREYTTDEGCLVYLSYKNNFDVSYSWSGACEAGKGITGKGELKQLGSGGDCSVFSGEMVNGYWIGSVPRKLYDSSCSGKVFDSRVFNFPVPEAAKLARPEPSPETDQKPAPVSYADEELQSNELIEVKLTNSLDTKCKQIHIFNKSYEKFMKFGFEYVYRFNDGSVFRKVEDFASGGGVRSRSTVAFYLSPGPIGTCISGFTFELRDFGYSVE